MIRFLKSHDPPNTFLNDNFSQNLKKEICHHILSSLIFCYNVALLYMQVLVLNTTFQLTGIVMASQ